MAEPLLVLRDVEAFYGRAQVLHGVSFELGAEPVAVIGRNGMGKTTLCLTIMGLMRAASGSIRFAGDGADRPGPVQDRRAGDRLRPAREAAVPLALGRGAPGHARSPERRPLDEGRDLRAVPAAPRTALDRRRAALRRRAADARHLPRAARNPQLLLMDEPSEGLAPTIVEGLVETCTQLVAEGMGLLLIEQNLGVATARRRPAARHGRGRDRDRDHGRGDRCRLGRPAAVPRRDAGRGGAEWPPSSSSARSTRRATSTRTCATGCATHGVDVLLVDAGVTSRCVEPDLAEWRAPRRRRRPRSPRPATAAPR